MTAVPITKELRRPAPPQPKVKPMTAPKSQAAKEGVASVTFVLTLAVSIVNAAFIPLVGWVLLTVVDLRADNAVLQNRIQAHLEDAMHSGAASKHEVAAAVGRIEDKIDLRFASLERQIQEMRGHATKAKDK